MNTKKLFMLLAAVLLGSVSAFAQSGNNEPLKGDVNEDGTVDVADLVNVIKIMKDAGGAVGEKMCYWYAGTNNGNAVTADNFTDVASRIPESEIPETGSVTSNGQYVYFVMPETKHVESLTYANGSAVEITCTDVMGYHIYKTTEMVNTTINYTIKQTTYYWYVGKDESLLGKNGTSYNLDLSVLPTVNSINEIYTDSQYVGDTYNNIYVVCPIEWVGRFKLTDLGGYEIPQNDKTSQIISGVTGYSILRGNGKAMDSTIKVIKQYNTIK